MLQYSIVAYILEMSENGKWAIGYSQSRTSECFPPLFQEAENSTKILSSSTDMIEGDRATIPCLANPSECAFVFLSLNLL